MNNPARWKNREDRWFSRLVPQWLDCWLSQCLYWRRRGGFGFWLRGRWCRLAHRRRFWAPVSPSGEWCCAVEHFYWSRETQ